MAATSNLTYKTPPRQPTHQVQRKMNLSRERGQRLKSTEQRLRCLRSLRREEFKNRTFLSSPNSTRKRASQRHSDDVTCDSQPQSVARHMLRSLPHNTRGGRCYHPHSQMGTLRHGLTPRGVGPRDASPSSVPPQRVPVGCR